MTPFLEPIILRIPVLASNWKWPST